MLVAVDIKGSCMTSVSWSIKQTFCVHPQHNRIEQIEVSRTFELAYASSNAKSLFFMLKYERNRERVES